MVVGLSRDGMWFPRDSRSQDSLYLYMSKCKVAYMDLQGIIPWRSCDFEY